MGEELRDIINQTLASVKQPTERSAELAKLRAKMIATFFALYQTDNSALAETYLRATLEIPFDKFKAALRVLVRSHHWPRLPLVADIWRAARLVAGMDREQYDAGRYLPACTSWPPEGKRHGIHIGSYEPLSKALPAITAEIRPLLTEGNKSKETTT